MPHMPRRARTSPEFAVSESDAQGRVHLIPVVAPRCGIRNADPIPDHYPNTQEPST